MAEEIARNFLGEPVDAPVPAPVDSAPVAGASFDLGQFNSVPLSIANAVDANGNAVDTAGVLPAWSASDGSVVTLSDQADGTTVVTRVSADGGSVDVTAEITNADGSTASATISLTLGSQVAPSDNIVSFDIVPGTPS